jgi:hypothetical protein
MERASPAPSWKKSGQTSVLTLESTIGKISAHPQSAVLSGSPHRAHRTPSRLQHPEHLLKGSKRIGHVHEAEAAEHGVEAGVGEAHILRVHPIEADMADSELDGSRRHELHHPLRDVRADHLPARPDRVGRRQRHEPRSAGQVQHPLALLELGHAQQEGLSGLELASPVALVVIGRPVPAVALNPALEPVIHSGFVSSGPFL